MERSIENAQKPCPDISRVTGRFGNDDPISNRQAYAFLRQGYQGCRKCKILHTPDYHGSVISIPAPYMRGSQVLIKDNTRNIPSINS
jgi:hypothetical protein